MKDELNETSCLLSIHSSHSYKILFDERIHFIIRCKDLTHWVITMNDVQSFYWNVKAFLWKISFFDLLGDLWQHTLALCCWIVCKFKFIDLSSKLNKDMSTRIKSILSFECILKYKNRLPHLHRSNNDHFRVQPHLFLK